MSLFAAATSASQAQALALYHARPVTAQDARILLAHAAGLSRDQLHRLDLRDFTPALSARFEDLLSRRRAGEPVSKILGARDFWKYRFTVTADVLDPRPETEILVAEALSHPFQTVLDLGTGSGAILLSLLAERPGAEGVGVDLSPAALAVAEQNARAMGLDGRARLIRSDWFDAVGGCFDLIVSNPPYIARDEMAGLSPEVRLFDPEMALTDGADGLGCYRIIAMGAPAHLVPGGWLVLEIGYRQGDAVATILRDAGLTEVAILPDLDGRDRVVRARRG